MGGDMGEIVVRRFDELPWTDDKADTPEGRARIDKAKAAGYKHKRLLAGEGDVFLNYVEMGPGFVVEPHSHDAREIIHVLGGSLTPHGSEAELTAGDCLVVPAGEPYGFRTGANGLRFVVMRPTDAGIAYKS